MKSQYVSGRRCLVTSCLLSSANDWVLLFDKIHAKVGFPSFIAVTFLRPDIVLYSVSRRIVAWVRLTVCVEDRVSASQEKKSRKYEDLASKCRGNGWQVWSWAVEVGGRGFVAQSLSTV